MSVYDSTTVWDALNRNPETNAEFSDFIDLAQITLLGTRPIKSLDGYWGDNIEPGFGISQYDKITVMIVYEKLTISEETIYEFDIDTDDFGELYVDGILVAWETGAVCTTIPISLTVGDHTFELKFQNGAGPFSFALRWRKQGEVVYVPVDYGAVGLLQPYAPTQNPILTSEGTFPDYPHKLTIKTELDGEAVRRRIEIRNRATSAYVASKITDSTGVAEFTRLPVQAIDEPHIITCFDDRTEGYLNALVFDRVFQVSDQGFPPEN